MKQIHFRICFCGMSEETIFPDVMIDKPHDCICNYFNADGDENLRISDLITTVLDNHSFSNRLGEYEQSNFTFNNILVYHDGMLLRFMNDMSLREVFNYFKTEEISLYYFIVGGASRHDEKHYRYTIHPDERVHAHTPHVHVTKDGITIRYCLNTIEPMDRLSQPHQRDNHKIQAFITGHKSYFLGLWNHYLHGFKPPELSESGAQFYPES